MTVKQKIELCAHCRYDGGWHYDEDGNATRPHHEAAVLRDQARALAEMASSEIVSKAREIVAAAAHELFEFSANNVRTQFEEHDIPESQRSAAFNWAKAEGLIVATGRGVMSTDPRTRHRLNIWRSVERARALGIAS